MVKKIFKFLSKKLQDFQKNSRIFQKTQCFGGYKPQLASKKPFNKQAWLKVHHIRSSLYQNYGFESRQKILTGRLDTSRTPCGRLAWGKVLSQSTEDVCSPDPWRVKPSSFRWWGSGGRLERVQSSTLYHHPSHKGCHRHPYFPTG